MLGWPEDSGVREAVGVRPSQAGEDAWSVPEGTGPEEAQGKEVSWIITGGGDVSSVTHPARRVYKWPSCGC